MDINDCYKNNIIKKTKINKELIKSLIEMSDIKEQAVNSAQLDSLNISVYFSIAYDSLREVLEAICISRGYKVSSHLCLGELLNTLINDFSLQEFDRFRYARNGINYYGTKIDFEQGKSLIKKMFAMKKTLGSKHLREFYSS